MTTELRTHKLRSELTIATTHKDQANEALGQAAHQATQANAHTLATLSRVAYLANECVCDLEDKLLRLLHSGSETGELPLVELCF